MKKRRNEDAPSSGSRSKRRNDSASSSSCATGCERRCDGNVSSTITWTPPGPYPTGLVILLTPFDALITEFLDARDTMYLSFTCTELRDVVRAAPWVQYCQREFGMGSLHYANYMRQPDCFALYKNLARSASRRWAPVRTEITSLEHERGNFYVNGHQGALFSGSTTGEHLDALRLESDGSFSEIWTSSRPRFDCFDDINIIGHDSWVGVNESHITFDCQRIPVEQSGRLFIESMANLIFLINDTNIRAFAIQPFERRYQVRIPNRPERRGEFEEISVRWLYGYSFLAYRMGNRRLFVHCTNSGIPFCKIKCHHVIVCADLTKYVVVTLEEDNLIHIYCKETETHLRVWQPEELRTFTEVKCYNNDIIALSQNEDDPKGKVHVYFDGALCNEEGIEVSRTFPGTCDRVEGRHGKNGFIEVVVEHHRTDPDPSLRGFSIYYLRGPQLEVMQTFHNALPDYPCDIRDCVITIEEDNRLKWNWLF